MRKVSISLFLVLALTSFSSLNFSLISTASAQDYKIETAISGLNSPWSLAFLPNGDQLITELGGKLRIVKDGVLVEESISGVPDVYVAGQGGLMDVVIDADFANNQRIYLSYAYGEKKANATRLISATLKEGMLNNLKVLFTATPMKSTSHHYGGRIAQLSDNSLLLTVGDGFNYREQAQKLDNHFGKIIRIKSNGDIPADNPWSDVEGALPEIWSMGHRNEQAILVTNDGVVYENEHGPKGGDEINVIKAGQNYGWPIITRGVDYNGAQITPFTEYEGMQQPFVDWTPSIAPSGMTYYDGNLFPEWKGDLFTVSLSQQSVRRVDLENGVAVSDERVFTELNQRMRDIRTGPDGAIYILTDGENGKLLRISPK